MDYGYKPTKAFDKQIDRLKRTDPKFNEIIDKALTNIRLNPKNPDPLKLKLKSHKLKGIYGGQRAYSLDHSNRIRYAICRECRNKGSRARCSDCDNVPDDTIVMLSAGSHKIAY